MKGIPSSLNSTIIVYFRVPIPQGQGTSSITVAACLGTEQFGLLLIILGSLSRNGKKFVLSYTKGVVCLNCF